MNLKFKIILIALIAISWSSCKNDGILSADKLEDILLEMHLSDGVFHTLNINSKMQNVDSIFRYKNIFEKYKCSRDMFEKSMRAYSRKQEVIDNIYNNLQERFKTMLNNYEGKNLSDFIIDIFQKFSLSLKSILSPAGKQFENVENIKDFVERLLSLHENISENSQTDSLQSDKETNIQAD
jgi:hypothetical protein